MKKIYVLILILSASVASAQNLQWARSMGGTGVDFGQAIAVDNFGNVYSTGEFMNTADFDPGPGVFNLTSAGSWDIYVSKLDSSGIFQWAKRIGSTGDDRGLALQSQIHALTPRRRLHRLVHSDLQLHVAWSAFRCAFEGGNAFLEAEGLRDQRLQIDFA